MIIKNGYLARRSAGAHGNLRGSKYRNWFFVKAVKNNYNDYRGNIILGNVSLPKQFIGRKVRFKVEEVLQ